VLADANPGIIGLPTATLLTLEEANAAPRLAARRPQAAGTQPPRPGQGSRPGQGAATGAAPVPVSWRSGEGPPPNLGPPPERLDWRKHRN
jgi:hypothetical protein